MGDAKHVAEAVLLMAGPLPEDLGPVLAVPEFERIGTAVVVAIDATAVAAAGLGDRLRD